MCAVGVRSSPPPTENVFMINADCLRLVKLLEPVEHFLRLWFFLVWCCASISRARSLLCERGYHLQVYLYLLTTSLTPVGEAIGRPLFLIELYAGVYAVYNGKSVIGCLKQTLQRVHVHTFQLLLLMSLFE